MSQSMTALRHSQPASASSLYLALRSDVGRFETRVTTHSAVQSLDVTHRAICTQDERRRSLVR